GVIAVNGAARFTVDLRTQRITGPGGGDVSFDIPAADRMRLIEGLDDIGLTLKHANEIASWEQRTAAAQPWLQAAVDRRLCLCSKDMSARTELRAIMTGQ